MTHILIKHRVNDYAKWKEVFEGFADNRRSGGEGSYQILHSSDNPNDLTLLFEWDSKENAKKFLQSQELKSAMDRAGVAEEPKIQFMNQVSEGTL